jgi:hypothetical protein
VMRPLSDRQANACEHAKTPKCRCRCKGAFHGAARVDDRSQLPAGDPHGPAEVQLASKEPGEQLALRLDLSPGSGLSCG